MILVSFSSAEDVLSNDVKEISPLVARKVLKICRYAFLHPVQVGKTGNR